MAIPNAKPMGIAVGSAAHDVEGSAHSDGLLLSSFFISIIKASLSPSPNSSAVAVSIFTELRSILLPGKYACALGL
jgi:hypothetical protein